MQTFIHSTIGLIHVIASILSLIFGTVVLLTGKGTQPHKSIGYGYALMMLIVNGTAFGLYGLFGKFGPFHVAALVSLATLVAGMLPVMLRKSNWLIQHFSFMYYSVIGLYAAFASEVIVRIPGIPFGPAVGLATALVMISAMIVFRSVSRHWQVRYNQTKTHLNKSL